MTVYVKTDYAGCPYITAGKVYVLRDKHMGYSNCIIGDNGSVAVLHIKDCGHLKYNPNIQQGAWTYCDKEGNEQEESK